MDLRKLCRICFVDGPTVDITEYKASAWALDEDGAEIEKQVTILTMLQTMFQSSQVISLELAQELPMMCTACVEECLTHYSYFRKLLISNRQLQQLYNEAQKAYEPSEVEECDESEAEELVEEISEQQLEEEENADDSDAYKHVVAKVPKKLNNNDFLIVSEFLPAAQFDDVIDLNENLSGLPTNELRTVDYAAVELKHNNLDEYNEANRLFDVEPVGSQAVYKCKYCPLAYASPQFLKTHVRKSHVCKYCTSAFVKIKDLNDHIRKKHSKHQCMVCSNTFSTSSNLRAHLKRVHGVQLPQHVALLDYRPASENNGDLEAEYLIQLDEPH
ncbi:uncharacterized protein LOC115626054 [Scaptodrosophila lebanonensis]|uniref:Uncharacterized protein LOC115626054 n=1 Tax=Drosophila lebanonensis TaxID=7225 RepID=A0A6J2TNR9_DROLE|nr:uncharacterized protein LOC115626054 [Scaptodrosophila lebanonensis]